MSVSAEGDSPKSETTMRIYGDVDYARAVFWCDLSNF